MLDADGFIKLEQKNEATRITSYAMPIIWSKNLGLQPFSITGEIPASEFTLSSPLVQFDGRREDRIRTIQANSDIMAKNSEHATRQNSNPHSDLLI